ncbi:MAG: T9SS type A sorting domain-containing protein, partial [Bacteroidota bacterium]
VMSALGLHLQYRADAGGSSAGPLDFWGESPPRWIRLDRTGTTVAAFRSDDGSTWDASGTVTVPGLGTGPVLVGLAVSAADDGTGREASGAFESVSVGDAQSLLPDNLAAKPVGFGIDRVFPNPARGRVTVRATLATDGPVVVEVLDVLGRRIAWSRIDASAGIQDLGLNLAASPAGTYTVRLRDEASGETDVRRLVIVR